MAGNSGNDVRGRQDAQTENNEGQTGQKRHRTGESFSHMDTGEPSTKAVVKNLIKTVAHADTGAREGVEKCVTSLTATILWLAADSIEMRQGRKAQEQRITAIEQHTRHAEVPDRGGQPKELVAFQQQLEALQGQVQEHGFASLRAEDRQQLFEMMDARITAVKGEFIVQVQKEIAKDKEELEEKLGETASQLVRTEEELAKTKQELARTKEQSVTFETRLGKIKGAFQALEADVDLWIEGGLDARIEKEVRGRKELEKRLDRLASTANSANSSVSNSRLSDE